MAVLGHHTAVHVGLHDKFMVGGVPMQFWYPMFGEILEGPIISQPNYEPETSLL